MNYNIIIPKKLLYLILLNIIKNIGVLKIYNKNIIYDFSYLSFIKRIIIKI